MSGDPLTNGRYALGETEIEQHLGHGGVNLRWDELDMLLAESRSSIPADARQASAEFVPSDRDERDAEDGQDYTFCWRLL